MSGSKKKSDTATVADWSFTEDPKLMKAIRNAAHWVAGRGSADEDDLFQEAVLFLAVRPDAVKADLRKGGINFVAHAAMSVMLTRAETTASYYDRIDFYDPFEDDDGSRNV